jgi:hypothetical protein
MIRTSWKVALLAGLASAGVAWAQPPANAAERIVTIRQSDGLPESCRLKKAWTTDDGRKAWLLQAVGSDMLLTVVEKARGPAGAKVVGVSIYPWGNDGVPPKGSPVPPRDAGILPATYTTEAAAPPRPAAAVISASYQAQATVVSPAAGCAPGHCDKGTAHCDYVHHSEQPPSLHFVCGGCLPVCSPEHSATYGYYPTQWRPYPGCAEVTPVTAPPAQPEPSSMPKVTLP